MAAASICLLFVSSALLAAHVAALQGPPAGCGYDPPVGTLYDLTGDPYLAAPPFTSPYTAPDVNVSYLAQNTSASAPVPEQIALFPAVRDFSFVFVQWVVPSGLYSPPMTVYYGLDPSNLNAMTTVTPKSYTYATGTAGAYKSGPIYQAQIGPLAQTYIYYYRIDGLDTVFKFRALPRAGRAPKSGYPFVIALIADVGETGNSSITLDHVAASPAEVVLFSGDVNYADRYGPPCVPYDGVTDYPMSLGAGKTCGEGGVRWDTWGRFSQKVFAYKPVAYVPGNHENEFVKEWGELSQFKAYKARTPALVDNGFPYGEFTGYYADPSSLPNGGFPSKPPLFYSLDIGLVHVIALSSYSPFVIYTHQYKWLQDDLCSINRNLTPWIFVIQHSPWYNTDLSHYLESEPQRRQLEPWLYNTTVDLVSSGHVHAYERSYPVYDYRIDSCGPIHVTVGDGGNSEMVAGPFLEPQPAYSAFREYSFGYAEVAINSATDALYTWYRNQDGGKVVSDSFALQNKNALCGPKKPSFC